MGALLAEAGIPIAPDRRPEFRFFERSDNIAFARLAIPAHTLSSYGLHRDCHRLSDEIDRIDLEHMARVIEAVAAAVRAGGWGGAPLEAGAAPAEGAGRAGRHPRGVTAAAEAGGAPVAACRVDTCGRRAYLRPKSRKWRFASHLSAYRRAGRRYSCRVRELRTPEPATGTGGPFFACPEGQADPGFSFVVRSAGSEHAPGEGPTALMRKR